MNHLGPTLRRGRRPDRPGLRTAVAVVVSLLLNGFLLSRIDPASLGLGPVKPVRPVDLASLSASDWNANRAIRDPGAAPAPPPAQAQPVPPPEQRKSPGQVVETASSNARPPRDTKYVSDRDSSVDKETRSRFRGPGSPAAPPGPTGQGAAAAVAAGGQEGKSEKPVEGRVGTRPGEGRALAMKKPATTGQQPVAGGEIPTLPWDPR